MSLNYVTLTLDYFDGQGSNLSGGTATFTPSVQLTDATDHEIVTTAGLVASFKSTGSPAIKLLATDNANITPQGWAWTVTFSGVSGSPAGFSFFLPFSGGATQNLSAISPTSSAVTQFPAWPGSALGDTVYGGASPAGTPTRLAGNTSTTQKLLAQTGTGSASAAPAWMTPAVVTLPPPTGVAATDTAAIQNAENALHAAAGGKILFQPGTYLVTGLVKHSNTTWQGAGRLPTVIKLANGSNADVIQGYQFASLTGTNSAGGITGLAIRDMAVDGNGANQTGASYGLRTYGYNFDVENVEISGCFSDARYSEWAFGFGQSPEARERGCKYHDNSGIGLNWQGPHDSVLTASQYWDNALGQANVDTHAPGTVFQNCHVYGTGAYGLRVAAQSVQWADGQAEASAGSPAVTVLANGFEFVGGSAYDVNGTASTAFVIGDGSHAPTMVWIETFVSQTNTACVSYVNSGGYNYAALHVYQPSGSVAIGTPGTGDTVAIKAGSYFTSAGSMPQANGSLNRMLLPDPGGTAYWLKIGTWSTLSGGRLRITVTGAGSYDADVASNARTVITASTGGGTPTPNIQGYWYTEGGTPAVDQVKCAKGATADTWAVWAHVVAGFTGDSFIAADTGSETAVSTFTWSLASGADPGVASSTVAVLTEQFQVHSPALFPGGITVPATQAEVMQATTGLTGYSLVNGTGTIISWTAPNDGLLHRVTVKLSMNVTVAQTGGTINATFKTPDGAPTQAVTIASGGQGVGYNYGIYTAYFPMLIAPGSTFSIVQASAMTAGTAKLWCEIWGS